MRGGRWLASIQDDDGCWRRFEHHGVAHTYNTRGTWALLATGWGAWFLVELLGFVLLPGLMFAVAYRERRLALARAAAVITVLGIMLNRFNITFVAFNWDLPPAERYLPSWMEIWVTVAFITFAVVAFRWIASRMPIMYEHPEWRGQH